MVTVADLLAVEGLGLTLRHAADTGATLRWVATSELVDPSPFLEGGEVLLTTGIETAAWAEEWEPYAARLAGRGVVALGLGLELTHAVTPEELVEACRRHRLTLFEVPLSTSFVAVSRTAASLLQAEEESATARGLEQQRLLVQAALREDDPGALVRRVAQVGVAACTVTTDGGSDLGPFGDRPEVLDPVAVRESVAGIRRRGLRAAASHSTPAGTLLVHPLGVRGRPSRYLVVGFAGHVTEQQRAAVATAVALAGLAEERHRTARESDRRLRARATELLVTGDRRTCALVLDLVSPPRPRVPGSLVVLRAAGSDEDLEDALGAVEVAGALAGVVAGELVTVVGPARARPLAEALVAAGLRVGLGETVPADRAAYGHETAGHALELTTTDSPVASWAETVHEGVLSLVDPDRAAAFGQAFLGDLAERGDHLVETLRSFLVHHGSLLKVAADLGVHRNTVRHRVAQVEEVLGRSLADPQARVDAWVALQARPSAGD
ncbi:PucR family transcriptional regulator [Nocardioides sp. GCM10027113]|uniref:PucR family transcriptional regulator n=1 Tax=unclassified Nocardioides TaxID=2615069 RepID=UPI00360FCCE9